MTPDPNALYRLRSGGGFAMDGPDGVTVGPVFGLPYRGDHQFVLTKPDSFEPVPVAEAVAPITADSIPLDDGPMPAHGSGLTKSEVLQARRDWQHDGPPQPWQRAGVSKATYIRHRHRYRLVPWPKGYLRRLTP